MSTSYTTVNPGPKDLPEEVIIIVGCVCGGIVVILTIVLVVLCIRRSQAKKKYHESLAVVSANGSVPGPSSVKPGTKAGVDNILMVQVNMDPSDKLVSTNGASSGPSISGVNGADPRRRPPSHGQLPRPIEDYSSPRQMAPLYDNSVNEEHEKTRKARPNHQSDMKSPPSMGFRTADDSIVGSEHESKRLSSQRSNGAAFGMQMTPIRNSGAFTTEQPQYGKQKRVIHEVVV